jgi:hypothetical protein
LQPSIEVTDMTDNNSGSDRDGHSDTCAVTEERTHLTRFRADYSDDELAVYAQHPARCTCGHAPPEQGVGAVGALVRLLGKLTEG